MLKTVSGDGTRNDISTNEEKGNVLHQLLFPERPPGSHILHELLYPDRIRYSFRPSLTQLCWCIARLHPHKVPGQDGIPNIVLKELLEVIAEYLLRIYWPLLCSTHTATTGVNGTPSCCVNRESPD